MAVSLSNKQLALYFLISLIAGFILGSVALLYPFGRDQGIYAYAGKLILEGKIDYKYVFDLKPPGVHFIFASAQFFFGKSMFSMRLFDIFWQTATGMILFFVTLKLTSSKIASLFSSVLYVFLYFRLDYWHTLQADGFLNLPFALSVLFLISLKEEISWVPLLLAGLLFGLAVLFKYTVLLFLPLLFAVFLFQTQIHLNKRFNNLLIYLSGFLLAVLLTFCLYLLADALPYFLDVQIVQTPLYAKIGFETESVKFITANVTRLFLGSVYSPLILVSTLLLIALIVKKQLNFQFSILFVWILSTLIGLIVQWKFFLYHFLVIIPPLSVGTSVFIARFRVKVSLKFPKLIPISIIVLLAVYFIFSSKPYIKNYADLQSYLGGYKGLEEIYIKKGITSDSAFMIEKTFDAISFVKANTNENDKIYVWGFDPLIYYLSGRDCVSRFIYNFPLYWKEENKKFQKEFLTELNKEKPKLILISQRDPLYFISGYKEDSKLMLDKFADFKSFVDNNYFFKIQVKDFFIYELKVGSKVN